MLPPSSHVAWQTVRHRILNAAAVPLRPPNQPKTTHNAINIEHYGGIEKQLKLLLPTWTTIIWSFIWRTEKLQSFIIFNMDFGPRTQHLWVQRFIRHTVFVVLIMSVWFCETDFQLWHFVVGLPKFSEFEIDKKGYEIHNSSDWHYANIYCVLNSSMHEMWYRSATGWMANYS